ncbi:unnamed protein product [Echinostoma caproni]|uniref:ACT domain-containing protein n=1 Tax=Echinostoma caproni TaxID=27848 RepID=A0A183B0M4_9TREM|nr:unnamed protein product [Echinostoma caproni]
MSSHSLSECENALETDSQRITVATLLDYSSLLISGTTVKPEMVAEMMAMRIDFVEVDDIQSETFKVCFRRVENLLITSICRIFITYDRRSTPCTRQDDEAAFVSHIDAAAGVFENIPLDLNVEEHI